MRRPLLAGNWKMYKTAGETTQFIAAFGPQIASRRDRDIVLCTPFPAIPAAVNAADGTQIEIGAQDVFWLKEGAYTGEVSAPMLAARRLPLGDRGSQRTPAILRRNRGNRIQEDRRGP